MLVNTAAIANPKNYFSFVRIQMSCNIFPVHKRRGIRSIIAQKNARVIVKYDYVGKTCLAKRGHARL